MNISERLNQFDFDIYEVDQQERLVVDMYVTSH
jgi:hypothetical protein